MAVKLVKTLTLKFGDGTAAALEYQCQLSRAQVVDNPDVEEVETFCGKQTDSTPNWSLEIGGFQDWGDVLGVCEILHQAYLAGVDNPTDPEAKMVEFEVKLGKEPAPTAYRSGKCYPTQDVTFGGEAGSPMSFEQTLTIDGRPQETALTPAAAAGPEPAPEPEPEPELEPEPAP